MGGRESECRHLRVDFQLFQAPLQELILSRRHLDEVGGVEGQALVVRTRQLPGKGQLISDGSKVWQILQVIEGAPGEYVACHPAHRAMHSSGAGLAQ